MISHMLLTYRKQAAIMLLENAFLKMKDIGYKTMHIKTHKHNNIYTYAHIYSLKFTCSHT